LLGKINIYDYFHEHMGFIKDKGHPRAGHEDPEGEWIYSSTLPSTSALNGGGWSMPRPDHFTFGKDLVPFM